MLHQNRKYSQRRGPRPTSNFSLPTHLPTNNIMTISTIQWNIRGFFPNKPLLTSLIDLYKPTIIALQETHTQSHHHLSLPRYQYPPYRKDRAGRGGGVAVFVHSDIPQMATALDTPLEAVACRIFLPEKTFTICSLYIPPDATSTSLTEDLNTLCNQLPAPYMICMDANAHHPDWGSPHSDSRGRLLTDWIDDIGAILLNNGAPTYLSSRGTHTHIDLTICSPELATLLHWTPHSDPHGSDHFPLIISSDQEQPPVPRPPRWNLSKANWSQFNKILKLPNHFNSPNESCQEITDNLLQAARQSIPIKQPSTHKSAHWWTPECTQARKTQQRAYTQYTNHRGNTSMWRAYKQAQAQFRYQLKKAKKQSWQTFVSSLTTQTTSHEIWDKLRRLRNKPTNRKIVLRTPEGTIISNPQHVSEALADQFAEKCSGNISNPRFTAHKATAENQNIEFLDDNSPWYNSPFTELEINLALGSSTSRSPGPDNIPYDFLKHLARPHLHQLLQFYNYLYCHGYPTQWKEGNTVPICKPNKNPSLASSYRPITLLSCLEKLLGKMVTRRLRCCLEERQYLSRYQSGFRQGHSTLDGVTRLDHSARSAIQMGEYCVAVCLDISSAFDSVWHHGLLSKLEKLGISGNMAKYIGSFLSGRKIRVTHATAKSTPRHLHSGVPQGSVISPTLFTIMINDIFDQVPPNIQTSLYADDGAMWTSSSSLPEALQLMQTALDSVSSWSDHWGLSLAPTKTSVLIMSLRPTRSPDPLLLNNVALPFVTTARFLGVTFDTRLTWRPHIISIRDRCRRDLQLLRAVTGITWGSDLATLRRIYCSLILPKIDYACYLYANASLTNLALLDRIQFAAARIILGALRCTPVTSLEVETDLLPLSYRRSQLLTQYGCRTATVPNHPISTLVTNYASVHHILTRRYTISAIGLLHECLESLPDTAKHSPSIPIAFRSSVCLTPVRTTLTVLSKKNNLNSAQWRAAFHNLCEVKYPSRTGVFTDGSSSAGAAGCAAWSSSFSLHCRLPSSTSVLTTELYAIYSAIKFISTKPGSYVIFSDSLSALHSIQSVPPSNHYLVYWIRNALSQLSPSTVFIEWVPSHVGIPGNEQADALARSSLSLNTINQIPPSISEQRRCIRGHFRRRWQRDWENSLQSAYSRLKPTLGPTLHSQLPRKHQVALTRLRLGVTRLSHEHLFNHEPTPQCIPCQTAITHSHVILHCTKYTDARLTLITTCRTNNQPFTLTTLLGPEFPCELLLTFLRGTGLITEL